jgi:plastocyanin
MMTFARTLPLGAIILLVAVALVTSPVRAADTEVKIDNFTFNPQQITIKADTTVVWTNGDDIPHMIASKTGIFKSKALDTDDKFSFTFATPGTYPYFCALHPHMTGTIVVEASERGHSTATNQCPLLDNSGQSRISAREPFVCF